MAGVGRLGLMLAVALGSVPAAAADQTFEGAWHIRVTSPHDVQASVLDGSIRRTVTFTARDVRVIPDVPDGQPERIEVTGVTESMLPYVKGDGASVHVRRVRDVATVDADALASVTQRLRR